MSAITTRTGLILDWRKIRRVVELWRRWSRALARLSLYRDLADCITVTP